MHHNPSPKNDRGKFDPGTVVRLKKTGEFALIKERVCLMDRIENFLHYHAYIEGREGMFALYDDDVDLESLPSSL